MPALEADLRSRIASLLRRFNALADAPQVWHAFALYCCRLLSRTQFRVWLHAAFRGRPDLREGLFALKEALDCSQMPNRVLRAVLDLASHRRRHQHHYRAVAQTYDLGATELRLLERSLEPEERAKLQQRWRRGVGPALSAQRLTQLATRFDPICRGLIKHYLTFAWQNDHSTSFLDLCSEMRVETLRLCRNYEIYRFGEERLLRSIHRGLENRVKNLAKQYGRQSRRSVERVHTAAPTRKAWYLEPSTLRLRQVTICAKSSTRRRCKDALQILAIFRDGQLRWLDLAQLYESSAMAKQARFETRRGLPRQTPLLCLSADLNDFRSTACSFDATLGPTSSITLHDVLPTATAPAESSSSFLLDLSHAGASKPLQAFARVVIGEHNDQFFARWVYSNHSADLGMLTPQQLGRLAAAWVGTDLSTLKNDLLATPTTLWSRQQLALLRTAERHDGSKTTKY